ncbi:MAG TPA: hypothetical protein VFI15_09020 [Candidatus Limnocylindrales bacterium]|nr:hypothetical protein [Candidatus Limnocylindrales bacterium]
MHVDRRLLGWGLFFILLGAVPLALRLGLLDEQMIRQWPLLWPVLLIGWGIGLLLRNTPGALLGGAITAVTFGIMGGSAIATGFGGIPVASGCTSNAPATAFPSRNGQLGGSGRAEIEFNCGTLSITSADGSGWSVSGTDRNGTGPVVDTAGGVSLKSPSTREFFGPSGHSVWNVVLPKAPTLDLGVTLNAGEGTVRLPGATIARASITLNAGSLTVDLGDAATAGDVNATVNAGSGALTLPAGDRSADLSLNAGSLQVCLPVGAPVRVEWSGAFGSNNFDAAGLVRVDNDTWTSAGLVASQPHTELQVSANAGSFELEFGGSCSA